MIKKKSTTKKIKSKKISDTSAPALKKMPPQNILIFYRTESVNAQKTANELCSWLKQQQHRVFSHPDQKIEASNGYAKKSELKNINLVIVLGGDGTYLQAVRFLREETIPILSINMGSLGFLSETRIQDMYATVVSTLENKMESRPRAMLDIKVVRDGKVIKTHSALNDVVVERGQYSQLINIAIYAENNLVNEVKADGILVGTPTGSTAYNLAAGGPILHPNVRALVVTPICPHALTHRPIIFPDNVSLTLRLLNKKHRALLNVDGSNEGDLRPGDEVIVTRSEHDHYVLRRPGRNYFDLLREKLRFGERA
jgi:NAD+ kinase